MGDSVGVERCPACKIEIVDCDDPNVEKYTAELIAEGAAAERARVVAYLRTPRIACHFEADEIESGEHVADGAKEGT